MRTRFALLAIVALFAAACGPSRDLRVERSDSPIEQPEGDGTSSSIRVVSGTTMWGVPTSLTANRGMVFSSVDSRFGVGIQAIDARTAQALGTVITSYPPTSLTTIAGTPNMIWILQSARGHSELARFDTGNLETAQLLHTIGVQGNVAGLGQYPLILPSDTTLVGGTPSAVWLLSHTDNGYTLVRRSTQTSSVRRFALQSSDVPGVAITPRRVFVLLRSGSQETVTIQTRDRDGRIVATSPVLKIPGFQPTSLRGCGDQIFGWTQGAHRVALFGIASNGEGLRISKRLPPSVAVFRQGDSSGVTGIELSDHCRTVWAATSNQDLGVVSRLRASSLAVTGRINTPYICALLWMDGSLWGASVDHAAIMRIR